MKARAIPALLAVLFVLILGCAQATKKYVYVTGPGTNEVFGFLASPEGTIAPLGTPTFQTGSGPVALAIHPSGTFAYVANFAGNNVSQFDRNATNGEFTVPTPATPPTTSAPTNLIPVGTGPVALAATPNGQFLYVLNQGSGTISGFSIDSATGNLTELKSTAKPQSPFTAPAGPKSLAIATAGNFLYVASPTLGKVFTLAIGADGFLGAPDAGVAAGTSPSWIIIDSKGKFLYAADSGATAVFGFAIQSSGALTPMAGSPFTAGTQPAAIAIDPQGAFLFVANKGSNNISAFVMDAQSGVLSAVAGSPFAAGAAPIGVAVDSSSQFLYVANSGTNDIVVFSIQGNGALASPAAPISVPTSPQWIAARN